jgi:hypothetical protein
MVLHSGTLQNDPEPENEEQRRYKRDTTGAGGGVLMGGDDVQFGRGKSVVVLGCGASTPQYFVLVEFLVYVVRQINYKISSKENEKFIPKPNTLQ